MGKSRTGSDTQTNQNSSMVPIETEYEKQVNPLDVELRQKAQGGLIETQQLGFDLVKQLLSGQQLPGYFQGLPGGISEDVTSSIAQDSIRDIRTQFQGQGLLDSGVAESISARSAADIRQQAAQYNLNNLFNLLNLGSGFQAQVQQPVLGFNQVLSNRLQGLRPINQSGTGTSSTNGWSHAGFFQPGGFGQLYTQGAMNMGSAFAKGGA